jgi:ubiquinone/menaquinone biosynthesis C-methylase UbiE
MLTSEARFVKARQLATVAERHLAGRRELRDLSLLDYGSSEGLMASFFAERFGRVVGVDVDRPAIERARSAFPRPNLTFVAIDSERTNLPEASFDVVVANQVYNYVGDQPAMFDEIFRVLKPGGFCVLSAGNKYSLIESQYRLPLLAMLPARLARAYLRMFRGTSTFVGRQYRSRSGIFALAHRFAVRDYTIDILRDPRRFGFEDLVSTAPLARILPLGLLVGLIPNYIIVLERPAGP